MHARLFASLLTILIMSAVASLPGAQWPTYPTAGVPRNVNGTPDLNGPTPRTAEGRPDFAGIWENRVGGARGAGLPPSAPGTPPLATFFNVGAGLKDAQPPMRSWAAELVNQRKMDNSKDNPDALCLPMGLMQLHTHPQPRKMVQTPGEIIVMYEANEGLRQIFLDGRPLPSSDPQPWWYGYSTGRWDGDTLVVETVGFKDLGWLDVWGSPLTDKGKMIERFRRPNFGTLEIDVTIDDPKAYTGPFTVRVNQRIMLDTELIEFVCAENQKFVDYLSKQRTP